MTLGELHEYFYYSHGFFFVKKPVSKKHRFGCQAGSIQKDHWRLCFRGKTYRVSKLVWFYHYGVYPKIVWHRNDNRLDCRLENLRV